MTALLDEIRIENNKAIERLSIPIPKDGGLVVLTGDNGCGKSEALEAVRAVLGDKDSRKGLEPRDGTKSGLVEGCGVTIKLGRVNRESGELTVAGLEDRLDISDLVDPGIIDLNAADASRLKALLKVSGVTADIGLFDSLLGPTYELDGSILKERDLIKMAGGVKRSFESKARSDESLAESCAVHAAACLEATKGIDLDAECDQTKLDQAYRSAVRIAEQLQAEADSAKKARNDRANAQQKLEKAEASYSGPTLDEAEASCVETQTAEANAKHRVAELERQLADAKAALKLATSEHAAAVAARDAATIHVNTIAEWRATLNQALPDAPTADQLVQAGDAVAAASDAISQGGVVRNAKSKRAEAAEWTDKQRIHARNAEKWRECAKGVDSVLSDLVATLGCPITVGEDDKGMRLMVNHRVRGMIPFAELSEGEKATLVIPIAINAVKPKPGDRFEGVFVIPQSMYEGLQPRVRKQIAQMLKGSRVVAITAECADGPLSAAEVPA